MDSERTTEQPVPSSRKRILRAALHDFEAHGYAGARVDHIAAEANANKQLVYRYFGNKRGLYEAVINELITALRDMDLNSVNRGESFLRRMAPDDGFRLSDSAIRESWTRILSWEGLQSADPSNAATCFIRENYTRYLAELEVDPEAANAVARFPARYVLALLLAADHLPYSTPTAFAAALGKETVDERDIAEWFQFVRKFVGAIGPAENEAPPAQDGSV